MWASSGDHATVMRVPSRTKLVCAPATRMRSRKPFVAPIARIESPKLITASIVMQNVFSLSEAPLAVCSRSRSGRISTQTARCEVMHMSVLSAIRAGPMPFRSTQPGRKGSRRPSKKLLSPINSPTKRLAGRLYTSRGDATCSSLPLWNTATRSDIVIASV